jgi:hypothetical protein
VASESRVLFSAEAPGAAARNFGRLPFMLSRAHCARFTKFKFLLYPQAWLPSTQAAAAYYALLAHPLRTENPAEACVLIGLTDVKAANQVKEPPEASAARLTRLPLWGSGENHVVLHYGDYAPGFDVQRAVLAASSFGAPFNRSYFNAEHPESLPQLQPLREGYDVVMPLAFFRCGYGDDFRHLTKFSRFLPRPPAPPPQQAQAQAQALAAAAGLLQAGSVLGDGGGAGAAAAGGIGGIGSLGTPPALPPPPPGFEYVPGVDATERPILLSFKGEFQAQRPRPRPSPCHPPSTYPRRCSTPGRPRARTRNAISQALCTMSRSTTTRTRAARSARSTTAAT